MPLIRNQGQGNINLWKERHPPHLIMETQIPLLDLVIDAAGTQDPGKDH